MIDIKEKPTAGLVPIGITVLVAAGLSACDLSVSNPGPVQDTFLDADGAHTAVVNGARLALSQAVGDFAYIGAEPARELTTAGRVYSVKLPSQSGQLEPDEIDRQWNLGQQARFVAEDGTRRLREVLGSDFSSSSLAGQALLYVGYSNRMLGENLCQAVIDGGSPQSHELHFERALDAFTEAIGIAEGVGDTETALAARAGRASVRTFMDDWAGAATDANVVPDQFEFQAPFSNELLSQYNIVYWVNTGSPYRSHSVVDTWFEDYFIDTGDPRVPWGQDPDQPVGDFSQVPWLFQIKHENRESPIDLATGSEMRLIEAEAALRNDDLDAAMDLVNQVRTSVVSQSTGQPLAPVEASSLSEGWAFLQRERGIELWLEARRLGDLRRWIEEGNDGTLDPLEDMTGRSLCFPIADSERRTNPNVPLG